MSRHDGTADQPQTPDQRRQACLALLALVRAKADPLFQPSPLASKQLLDNFAGEDPDNPSVKLSTPRAMADRYMELYHNAQHMRAMLQPEFAFALQLLKVMTRCFSGLGDQVLDSLCRNGITTSTGYHLYELVELTLDLIGTSASKIWELNQTAVT